MIKFFLFIYDSLDRHRKLTFLLFAILAGFLAFLSLKVGYEEDIAKFLPRSEKNKKYSDVYQDISPQKRIAVIFSSADSSRKVETHVMEESMDYMGSMLEGYPNLQVTADEDKMDSLMEFVYLNMPYLMTCEEKISLTDSILSDSAISRRLTHARQMLESPMGDIVLGTLQYDPLGLFTPTLSRLRELSPTSSFQITDGYLFSSDGRYSMITFDTPYGSSETYMNSKLASRIDSMICCFHKKYPHIRVSAIGAPLVAVTNAQQIKTDSLIAVSVAVVLIMALLLWHYRRISDILWIAASLAFGFLFGLAGMAVFYDSISIIVLGMGSIIIGIAVNYPLHFLDHLREVPDKREALKEMIPPLLIGNVTTVAAFFCLVFLDAQAMRDLGAFGSMMLIGTILFVLVFLPQFVKSPAIKESSERQGNGFIDKLAGRNLQKPWLFPLVCVITLILGYFSLHTSFDSNLQHINYMTEEQRANMKIMTSSVKESPMYAVSEGKTLEEALNNNNRLLKLLDSANVSSQSISNFIDVSKTAEGLMGSGRESFISRFSRECRKQGMDEEAFRPFLDILSLKGKKNLVDFRPFIEQSMGTYVQQGEDGWRIVNYVSSDDETLKYRLNRLGSSFYAFTPEDVSNQVVDLLNDSFNYVGLVCSFVVFFFLWISFRRIELSVMAFLPLAVGWIWILGLMYLFGIQFNIVNVILASFIFGQGDDYTIFITEGLLYEYTTGKKRLSSYRRSVMVSAMLMFVGMGCLIFARHPALHSLGEVTIIGMFTVVVMAYYLPPLVFCHLVHGRMTSEGKETDFSVKMPITFKRRIYSVILIMMFTLSVVVVIMPYALFLFHVGKVSEKKRLKLHRLMQRVCHFIMHHIPGVDFQLNNVADETFEKPAVLICNHQSVLDLLSIIMLTPRVVFLTNEREWHNPLYGRLIHYAEFYPVGNGVEFDIERMRNLFSRGYSICVFPEGTRSPDCRLLPFHKGAFNLARQLGADIVPMFIHGAGHVVPKYDFMNREGSIYLEVNGRVTADEQKAVADEKTAIPYDADGKVTRYFSKYYKKHFSEICSWRETEEYRKPYRNLRDYYKVNV